MMTVGCVFIAQLDEASSRLAWIGALVFTGLASVSDRCFGCWQPAQHRAGRSIPARRWVYFAIPKQAKTRSDFPPLAECPVALQGDGMSFIILTNLVGQTIGANYLPAHVAHANESHRIQRHDDRHTKLHHASSTRILRRHARQSEAATLHRRRTAASIVGLLPLRARRRDSFDAQNRPDLTNRGPARLCQSVAAALLHLRRYLGLYDPLRPLHQVAHAKRDGGRSVRLPAARGRR